MIGEVSTVMQCIIHEIEYFKCNHNGFPPEKIFISYPLYAKIEAGFRLYQNSKEPTRLHGVPVKPYECEKDEFYLAERKGTLIDDIELIFSKAGDSE